jgi:GntR family transcriptional regulator, transcriptional repressor for pyruvate dehydrogenase complex
VVEWSKLNAQAIQVSDGLSATLEEMIRKGTLGHEERLPPERLLAQQLRVSRTSLREALHELELKGLIDRRPGRGTVVLDPDMSGAASSLLGRMTADERNLRHVMDLRAAIEPPIAARAAERATPRDRRRLRELLDAMEAESSPAALAALDVAFHGAIADAAHNPHLSQVLEFAAEWIDQSRRVRVFDRRRREQSIRAHQAILDRIDARDADGAASAMHDHIVAVNGLLPTPEG